MVRSGSQVRSLGCSLKVAEDLLDLVRRKGEVDDDQAAAMLEALRSVLAELESAFER